MVGGTTVTSTVITTGADGIATAPGWLIGAKRRRQHA